MRFPSLNISWNSVEGTRSQIAAALLLGVTVVIVWLAWAYWGRAPLFFAGLAGAAFVALIFARPIVGCMLAAFMITSNFGSFVPFAMSGVLVLTLMIVLFRKLLAGDLTLRITPTLLWAVLFLTWYTVSIVWAGVYDNFSLAAFYRGLLVLIVFTEVVRKPAHLIAVILAAGVGLIVTGIWSIQSAIEFLYSGAAGKLSHMVAYVEESRYYGQWEEPNAMALALVPMIAASYAVVRTKINPLLRLLALLSALFGLAAVALSLSRGGMICAIVGMLIIVSADKRRWLLFTGIAVVIAAILSVVPLNLLGRLETLLDPAGDRSIKERSELIMGGVEMIEDSFPIGVGTGNFRTYSTDYAPRLPWGIIAHNTYLDVTAESGIIGLLFMLGMLTAVMRAARRRKKLMDARDFETNISVCLKAAGVAVLLAMLLLSAVSYAAFWLVFALISVRPFVFRDEAVSDLLPDQ